MKTNNPSQTSDRIKPGVKTGIKWTVFVFAAALMYTFSTAGGSGSKAMLLFPAAMSVAVYETEIPSALFGSCAGLLLDISLGKLPGFTALWLLICCSLISVLFRQLLRKNIINFLGLFLLFGGIYLYIDYYFYYKIWGYEGYRLVLTHRLIPSALKTLGWALPVFAGVYVLERLCGSPRKLNLEEQDKNIERV